MTTLGMSSPSGRRIDKGYEIAITADGEVELFVTDGFQHSLRHTTTIGGKGVDDGAVHVVTFIADGGPKIVSVVVDERLDDGGDMAPQGWAFVSRELGEVGGSEIDTYASRLLRFVVYDRALLTSEAVSASRSLA